MATTCCRTSTAWNSPSLLRLCALFDLFDYGDCAIELFQDIRERKWIDVDFDLDPVIDALTPEVTLESGEPVVLKYPKYRAISDDVRKRLDQEQRAAALPSRP